MNDKTFQQAVNILSKDSIMKQLIQKYDVVSWHQNEDLFSDIVETIVNQQLSTKAASSIFNRVKELLHGFITPYTVLRVSEQELRDCGLSRGKVGYIQGLAKQIADGVFDLRNISSLSDEEVLTQLIGIRGIGKWSAEMILIFSLRRPDVFSVGDLGLRTAISRLYHIDRSDTKTMEKLALRWSPYRSVACWYLWRSLENKKVSKDD